MVIFKKSDYIDKIEDSIDIKAVSFTGFVIDRDRIYVCFSCIHGENQVLEFDISIAFSNGEDRKKCREIYSKYPRIGITNVTSVPRFLALSCLNKDEDKSFYYTVSHFGANTISPIYNLYFNTRDIITINRITGLVCDREPVTYTDYALDMFESPDAEIIKIKSNYIFKINYIYPVQPKPFIQEYRIGVVFEFAYKEESYKILSILTVTKDQLKNILSNPRNKRYIKCEKDCPKDLGKIFDYTIRECISLDYSRKAENPLRRILYALVLPYGDVKYLLLDAAVGRNVYSTIREFLYGNTNRDLYSIKELEIINNKKENNTK
jgi:hypothetical protein